MLAGHVVSTATTSAGPLYTSPIGAFADSLRPLFGYTPEVHPITEPLYVPADNQTQLNFTFGGSDGGLSAAKAFVALNRSELSSVGILGTPSHAAAIDEQTAAPTSPDEEDPVLPRSAIVGIAIGASAGLLAVVVVAVFIRRRQLQLADADVSSVDYEAESLYMHEEP